MLTLHVPASGDAVVVAGARIAALGPADELARAHPGARERRWAGVVHAGRCHADAARYLEETYHPDPRESGELGTAPLTGAALPVLDDTRWGHSARRGLQRLLGQGVTALVGPFSRPAVRVAVRRSGLPVYDAPRTPVLAVGGPAHFTVSAPDGACLATAVSGRLVYRRG
ncbi:MULTISPECIES: imidazolonepropionase-like domain-containing protein [Streptomyces]|uniref:imidazolonepropionase-like domain-containing protein n=1 Tax=Streptomyces TaxID=1883 RepID=UPI0022493D7F|nr:hypothetical protein [Streptomyces sp. JHD 1]MCX2969772.1 hypothetical protein [Streptomyces sp. JHD 1]